MPVAFAAFFAVAPLGAVARGQSDPLQKIVRDTVGCPTLDGYKDLAAIGEARDAGAFEKFIVEHECRNFKLGEFAWLHDVSMFARAGCLRPVGETRCYWVRVIWFKPDSSH